MAQSISNSESIIDSRDVIERIEELQDERDSLSYDVEDAEAEFMEMIDKDAEWSNTGLTRDEVREKIIAAKKALAEWDASDEAEELKNLLALQKEAEDIAIGVTERHSFMKATLLNTARIL